MNRQLEQALRHVEKHTDDETADEIRQHIEGLEKQLETARKALDRIRLHNDSYVAHRIASEALAQIGTGAGQKAGYFCNKCGYVGPQRLHPGCNYTAVDIDAGQKGGE